MYTALEDEVFLAPESIISGVLAADFDEDELDAPGDHDFAAAEMGFGRDGIGARS
ncbi:MAG: hypothetical protein KJ025_20925 [Burkholderiales bacterium]|nr:hypothetical protein [Burkholderiales bacterium]